MNIKNYYTPSIGREPIEPFLEVRSNIGPVQNKNVETDQIVDEEDEDRFSLT